MNRHTTDAVSLAFGWVFLAVAAWWLVVQSVHVDLPSFGWFFAGALIIVGVLGLAAAVWPRRRQSQ